MSTFRLRTRGAALLIALAAACATATPAGAANKPYSVAVSPSTVAGGARVTFQATFTNLTSPQHIGSANLTAPAGFSVVSASTPTGTATPSGNVVQLRDLDIQPNASLTVTVVADVPCAAGVFTWLVAAKQDNNFSGPPGNDFGPLRDSSLTTSVTGACGVSLRFVGQPAGAGINQTITTTSPPGGPVTVEVIDSAGNRLTTSNAVITMGVAPGSGPGALEGTTTVTAVNGLATFSDLSIDTRGSYALLATSPGLTSATSDTFSIDEARTQCVEDVTCSATLSNANAAFLVTAQGNTQIDAGLLTANRNFGLFAIDCAGYTELSPSDFQVDFLANAAGREKLATLTFTKATMNQLPENGAAHLEMCFGAPFEFAVKPGTTLSRDQMQFGLFVGLLPDCGTPPCVSRRNKTQAGQGVIEARAPGGDQDPRFSG